MIPQTESSPEKLPGRWTPPSIVLDPPKAHSYSRQITDMMAFVAPDLFSSSDCKQLIEAMQNAGTEEPVGTDGYSHHGEEIGSYRATAWAPQLGMDFWNKIKVVVPKTRKMNDYSATDWFADQDRQEHRSWRAIGVSPLLRFMRYLHGGRHNAHYDMGYDYGDGRRTLMSFVLYLTTTEDDMGGCTRFIEDGQGHKAIWQRCHDDWIRPSRPDEVIAAIRPIAGQLLFFDHRLCHDVEEYTGSGERIIIRGDIVFWAGQK